MSKVTVIFESTMAEDGVDSRVIYQQRGVEDLNDLSWVLAEATRASGYSVKSVAIHTETSTWESDL